MKSLLLFLSSFIIGVGTAVAVYVAIFASPIETELLRAHMGNAGSAYRAALAYETGQGIEQDFTQARHWYEVALARGARGGAMALASIYARGIGGPENMAGAISIYKMEAEAGNTQAQMQLARAAFLGNGMEKNETEGAAWVKKAAEAGSTEAMGLLGSLYYGGIGVPQNFDAAQKWLMKSGDKKAATLAEGIAATMEPIAALPPEMAAQAKQDAFATAKTTIRQMLATSLAKAPPKPQN
ncbi:MAG: tetratricopeptide repeat protein [Alphaproteobacteria bacterium]|nr:tetratricopeptide repeat protein [Alphaproteobacteria bacterium]